MPVITRALNETEFRQLLVSTFPHLESPYRQGADQKPAVLGKDGPTLRNINRGELLNDFAKIGSFLSNTAQVDIALQELERAIGVKLQEEIANEPADGTFHRLQGKIDTVRAGTQNFDYQGLQGTMQSRTRNARGNRVLFKTHKLLSKTLKAKEDQFSFSNVSTLDNQNPTETVDDGQPLHSEATFVAGTHATKATSQGAVSRFTPTTPVTPQNRPPMPTGAGYLTDVVGGRDFNRILLRHGYHWKDPGAQGVTHGEYTHRIQWYALLTHWDRLRLINHPLLVFKAMGCLWSRSNWPAPPHTSPHTFLWELLFDCLEPPIADPGRGYATTYNCPDVLMRALTQQGVGGTLARGDPLYMLKVLLTTRRFKRQMEIEKPTGADPAEKFLAGRKQPTLVFQQRPAAGETLTDDRPGGFIVWYNS